MGRNPFCGALLFLWGPFQSHKVSKSQSHTLSHAKQSWIRDDRRTMWPKKGKKVSERTGRNNTAAAEVHRFAPAPPDRYLRMRSPTYRTSRTHAPYPHRFTLRYALCYRKWRHARRSAAGSWHGGEGAVQRRRADVRGGRRRGPAGVAPGES